jgi:hypothetical protein
LLLAAIDPRHELIGSSGKILRGWHGRTLIWRNAAPGEISGIIGQRFAGKRTDGMGDTILAYVISLGLIGAGLGWIAAGSALCTTIGIASIVVGVISVSNEFRRRRG